MLGGHDDEGRPHRRPRQPRGADRPLWPHQSGRGVFAYRTWIARRARAGVMNGSGFSAGRVWAMLLRYLYLLRSSWPRTLELTYWPTLQMLIWGFMSQFLYVNSTYVFRAFGVLLAAVILWTCYFAASSACRCRSSRRC